MIELIDHHAYIHFNQTNPLRIVFRMKINPSWTSSSIDINDW